MADQVNPTGSLAPAIPMTYTATPKPPPGQERARTAKTADPSPKGRVDGRPEASAAQLDSAIQEFGNFLQQNRSDLMFQVDESSGRTYFKIVDAQTKEVIRQVPSEEILAMARKLRALADPKNAQGVLVDKEG